jgi:hypothetical protein
MSELDKLKKENKQLKGLLKNAVQLLNTYREFLKHPETLGAGKKVAPAKRKTVKGRKKKAST